MKTNESKLEQKSQLVHVDAQYIEICAFLVSTYTYPASRLSSVNARCRQLTPLKPGPSSLQDPTLALGDYLTYDAT